MRLLVNGREVEIADGLSIAGYVAERRLIPERIIVEHNAVIINRDQWETVVLNEADQLEILTFVGGG